MNLKIITSKTSTRSVGKQETDRTQPKTGSDKEYEQLNQALSSQNANMRIVVDNMSRNVIIYTPPEQTRSKFRPPKYPDKLRELDNQIVKYKKALEAAYA